MFAVYVTEHTITLPEIIGGVQSNRTTQAVRYEFILFSHIAAIKLKSKFNSLGYKDVFIENLDG